MAKMMERPKQTINILPHPTEHITVIGQNGSGKTYLLRRLAQILNGKVIIHILNTKDDDEFQKLKNYKIATKYDAVKTLDSPVRIYTPIAKELADKGVMDKYLNDRFREGNCITIIDEVQQVFEGSKPGEGFLNLLARGRKRNAVAWIGVQRPANVSRYPFSESKAFYIFRLNDSLDRKRVGEFTHPVIATVVPPKYKFWFYRIDMDEPVMLGPV